MIPSIIHQTCPNLVLPEALEQNVISIQEMNPGFEYRLYDDEAARSLISDQFGSSMVATYDAIDTSYGAAKADLFRYLVMLSNGGVYLDIKSTTVKPLGASLRPTDRLVLSHWARRPGRSHWGMHPELASIPAGELQQWHIIAEAGHPFLQAVVDEVCRRLKQYTPWRDGVGWLAVLRTTGPIMYTQTAASMLPLAGCRIVGGENELGLEYSVFADDTAHKGLLSGHYVDNSRPLTRISNFRRAAFWTYQQQARAGSLVRGALRPKGPP